jgi:hypothetical protein
MLKFYLDFFAFIDIRDSTVRGALQHGGDVAILITKIMYAALRAGGFDGAPWEERHLHKYLVDETVDQPPTTILSCSSLSQITPSGAFMKPSSDAHPSGFFADSYIKELVLGLPPNEHLAGPE